MHTSAGNRTFRLFNIRQQVLYPYTRENACYSSKKKKRGHRSQGYNKNVLTLRANNNYGQIFEKGSCLRKEK